MQKCGFGKTLDMWILIVAFVLLFLILLLSMPLIVEARVRIGLRGAIVRGKLYLLGLIPIPVRLTVRLFSEPCFTLQIGKKRISLLSRPQSGTRGITDGVRLLHLYTVVTAGVEGDPAVSTVLSGLFGVLLSMLIPLLAEMGGVRVRPAKQSMVRLSFSLGALVQPVDALIGFWRERRIARAKAANNSRKPKEKRTV